ncbi:uncharacterized protein LOC115215599 [Octopus sinensis]|uniref:Uncharacterized protein LOC115215599 n=1 Tax=Octopus sinensis TaxID=2607531 RepID=A0A6P7SQZ9_9MOLL|nr:uncharacterized protein LOC115215599 [Octopus sinensis]
MRDLTLVVAMFRLIVLVAIVAAAIAERIQLFPESRMTKYDYNVEVKLSVNKIDFWTAAKLNSLLEVHNRSGILTTMVKDLHINMFHDRILTQRSRDEPIMPMLYYPLNGKLVDVIREEMQRPTSFKLNAGHTENITFAGEHFIAKNMKRGLIQVLQVPETIHTNFTAGQTETRYEASVLGFCETTYIYSPCNTSKQCQEVVKRINLKKCIGTPLKKNSELKPLLEKIRNDTKNNVVTVKYRIYKKQNETTIERASVYSILYDTPTMKRDGQISVQFIQSLLRRSSEISSRPAPNNLTASTGVELIAEVPLRCDNMLPTAQYVKHVDDLLRAYRESNSSLAYIIYEIKNLLRCADQEKFDELIKKYANDRQNFPLLWDIIPAVDSPVMRKGLKIINAAVLEKKPLLLTLYAEHQTFDIETFNVMKELANEIPKEKKTLRTSAYLALSSYAHKCIKICEKLRLKYKHESGLLNSTVAEFPRVPHGIEILLKQLKEEIRQHNETRKEMLSYFLGLLETSQDKVLPLKLLRNLGNPESLPVLIDIIKSEKSMMLRILAADSLLRMPMDTLVQDKNSELIRLYMSVQTPQVLRIRLLKALIVNSLNDDIWQLLVSSIRYEPNCYVAKWAHTYIRQLAESEYEPIKLWTVKARKAMAVWPVWSSPCFESQKGVMDIYELIKERVLYPVHISKHLESLQESIAVDIQLLPVNSSVYTLILRGRLASKLDYHDYEIQLQLFTQSLRQVLEQTTLWLLKDTGIVFSLDKESVQSLRKLQDMAEVIVSSEEVKVPTFIGALLHAEQSQVYVPKLQYTVEGNDIVLTNPRWFSYWESRAYLDGEYMKPGVGLYEETKLSAPGTLKINLKDKSVLLTVEKGKTPTLDVYKSFFNFVEFEPMQKLIEGFIPRLIEDDFVQPDSRILAYALALGPVNIGGIIPETWKQPLSAIISLIYGVHHQRMFVETSDVKRLVKATVTMTPCESPMTGRIVNLAVLAEDNTKYVDVKGAVCYAVEETQVKANLLVEVTRKDAEKKQVKAVVKVPLRKPSPVECLWDREYQEQVKEQLANVSVQNIKMLPYLVPHWQARMADELNAFTQYSSSKQDPKVTLLDPVTDTQLELLQLEIHERVEDQRRSISSLNVRKNFTKLVTEVLELNVKVIKYINESLKLTSQDVLQTVKYFHQRNVIIARQTRISKHVEEMFRVISVTINTSESSQRQVLRKQLVILQRIFVEKVKQHIQTVSPVILKKLPVERKELYRNALLVEKLYLEMNPSNINETSRNISLRLELLLKELPKLFDFDSEETELLLLEIYRLRFYPTIILNETQCSVGCKFQKILLKSWHIQQDVVIYEKLLSEIRYYNMTCAKLSASCFSLNLKYMVLRLLHDFMGFKRASWENIIEEKPERILSAFQQLYQTLDIGVKLVEMKEPNLQRLSEDGGLPLYIELNEFLVKLQQISLYLLNEPSSDWHATVSQNTDMKRKQLKKTIVELFERVQRISRVESSKIVKPRLHSKSKLCDIPKSVEVEIKIEVDEKPLVTLKANFQKTPEQLKKEVDIGLFYFIQEERLSRPYPNITKDLIRGLNSYKSVQVIVDWQNKPLPQPVVTVLGHVRDWIKYLLRDYLVIKSVPESQINKIEIIVQQMMKSKMVNVHLHAGSKIYLITSIPVPIDILITPPSYRSVISGLQKVKSADLRSLVQGTTERIMTTTTSKPVQEIEKEIPRREETKKSAVNSRHARAAERSSQPTRTTPSVTTETLLSDILKRTTPETIVSTTTREHELQEARETVAPELKITIPKTQHVDIKKSSKEETLGRVQTTTPVTKPSELHKILKAQGEEITTHRPTVTPMTFAVKERRQTEPANQKTPLGESHSTTPSVQKTTTMKPATLREAGKTTSHTTKSPRQEQSQLGKVVTTLSSESQ